MYRDRSKIIRRIVIIGILLLALGGGAVALHSVYTVRTVCGGQCALYRGRDHGDRDVGTFGR